MAKGHPVVGDVPRAQHFRWPSCLGAGAGPGVLERRHLASGKMLTIDSQQAFLPGFTLESFLLPPLLLLHLGKAVGRGAFDGQGPTLPVCSHEYTHICTCICIQSPVHTHVHTCTHTETCSYVPRCANIYTQMFTCLSTHTLKCAHTSHTSRHGLSLTHTHVPAHV